MNGVVVLVKVSNLGWYYHKKQILTIAARIRRFKVEIWMGREPLCAHYMCLLAK